jgi:hypothetical protein
MKTIETIFYVVGRFAVGFGSGLALVCAFVIVTTDIGLGTPKAVQPAEVVHLDPVVVTISSERYEAMRQEAQGVPVLVETPDRGARPG